jgi:hypothetical protein
MRALKPRFHLAIFFELAAVIILALLRCADAQPAPAGGSIHGYVAVKALEFKVEPGSFGGSIQAGALIAVPNITVTAQNLATNTVSAPVVTNPQGFFQTPDLPAGRYRICVSGAGFASSCDDAVVDDPGPYAIMNHFVPIRPTKNAIIGTVTLADRSTPCFWFRPSISPNALTAKVSLQTLDGKVIAGPVDGNAAGIYVLPVTQIADRAKLHVECDASVTETNIAPGIGATIENVAITASKPSILAFDFTKGGLGIRRADPGDTVTVTVLAKDPDGNPLHYAWVDDSGRSLNLPDAPTVQWPLLNANASNALHVQVSNGKGGVMWFTRSIQAGPNAIFFSGHVFNRQTSAGVAGATISLNGSTVTSDAAGNFQASVPDASRFVLNVTHPGYALSSVVLINQAAAVQIPLDQAQTLTVNGATGGTINVPPGSGGACNCACKADGRSGDDDRFHILVEIPDTRIDIHHGEEKREKGAAQTPSCPSPSGGAGNLGLTFEPGSFVSALGATYTGTVSVEAFQYDLNQPNPIPGDFGGIYQGKLVRLGTFGAFHLLPRDAQGQPLAMAAGKQASVSMPIQPGQLAVAPATIPLFHYDESSGNWLEDGTLTRSGNNYVGQITHFTVFNADTQFPGGACVKVLLNGFTPPVTLNGSYYDPLVGSFHHPNTPASDTTIGVERLVPNQLFTLTVTDSSTPTPAVVTANLNSGPGLNTVQFPSGYDTITPNGPLDLTFSACNGPFTINNLTLPANEPYFLGPAFGGTLVPDPQQNPTTYQQATDAQTGGTRNTLAGWKAANGFTATGTPAPGQQCAAPNGGEFCAVYFNNGDLKFGRDMHCRVTNANGATACYVSNFNSNTGHVGEDDAPGAISNALSYEASGQSSSSPQPAATVTMEFDPVKYGVNNSVQFWAYGPGPSSTYISAAALDSQGAKPLPGICLACHQGSYNVGAGNTASGAQFLPFDLDSFLDGAGATGTPFPTDAGTPFVSSQQTSFHALNNMISAIEQAQNPQVTAIPQLIQPPPSPSLPLWYSNATTTAPFLFSRGAAQLPLIPPPWSSSPGNDPFPGHEPLYDSVVKEVCRTCHVATPTASNVEWSAFAQMSGGTAGFIQQFACGPAAYQYSPMPHAEVPWLRFWQQSVATTLAGELSLNSCPPPP